MQKHTCPSRFASAVAALALPLVLAPAAAVGTTLDPADFTKEVSFTVSGYDGASTLEHFPVLVRLSEGIAGFSYADIGSTTNAAYANLRFADASHANLDYEIEEWNPAGTSFVWVSLPSLSGTATTFNACYAPADGATLPNVYPTNVWTSAGYVGVWHMNSRIGKNSAATYPDATGTATATHSDASSWQGEFRTASNSTTANGTTWLVQNPPLVVSNDFTQAWTFSQTGCSLEAWRSGTASGTWTPYFTDGANNAYTFCVGVRGDSTGQGGGVWFNGQSTVRVYPGESASNTWHFITAVCPAAGSSGDSVLYGEDGSVEDEITELFTVSASKVAAVDYTQNGMGLTTVIGGRSSGTWCDELRVRRGVSTRDWVQANYDTQRDGTDFLTVGAVRDPHVPVVSGITQTDATATIDYTFAGIGDGATALFVAFPSFETNAVAVADLARPSARATGLSPDTDYTVTFVVENGGAVVYETLATTFTTEGRPALDPRDYRYSVTFTASGYDGAETLEHFPVLVHLSETTVPGFSYAGVNPAGIRFTAADGSLLAHEVETWDPTGLSTVWVGLPALSGTDTTFTMYWKPLANAGVAAQPVFRVWKYAGYVGVWHLSSIVKNQSEAYQAYNAPLWGQVFPDSAGCGANATKGTTTWNTYLQNAPGERFSESLGRANGSLGANGYTPFLVPPTADGGGAGDWRFSTTGYSTEAWVFPSRQQHNILVSGNSASTTSDGFIYAGTNGVRLCAGDWGGSTVPWSPDNANESFWHFVTVVWTPSSSSDPSVLYGTSGDGAPTKLVERSGKHATDQCATDGMLLVGGSGVDFGLDEIRVRRGLSTADWIQANWDTQRVGTDFLSVGEIENRQGPTTLLFR